MNLSYPLIILSKLANGFSFSSEIIIIVSLASRSVNEPIISLLHDIYPSSIALLIVSCKLLPIITIFLCVLLTSSNISCILWKCPGNIVQIILFSFLCNTSSINLEVLLFGDVCPSLSA